MKFMKYEKLALATKQMAQQWAYQFSCDSSFALWIVIKPKLEEISSHLAICASWRHKESYWPLSGRGKGQPTEAQWNIMPSLGFTLWTGCGTFLTLVKLFMLKAEYPQATWQNPQFDTLWPDLHIAGAFLNYNTLTRSTHILWESVCWWIFNKYRYYININ